MKIPNINYSFVNGGVCSDIEGNHFKHVKKQINEYVLNILKEKEITLITEKDINSKISYFINFSMSNPDYSSQTKEKLTSKLSNHHLHLNKEFLNKFQKIVIIPDRDKAGKEALKEVAKVLPRDKVYVVELPLKDTNDMLLAEQQQDFVDRYFKAKPYVPDGVLGSGQLYQSLLEATEIKKIPLPPFLHELEEMLSGGLTLESIVNIAAASGIGKSSYINELIYHWIFNSPYKVGVVSLELSAGQYANALFSRHVHKKLSLLSQGELKIQ
jgi:hypothetical protein